MVFNKFEEISGFCPDIYAVDVDSMKGNQRTIAYLSQLKYPEIYEWLIDKIDANDTVSAAS